MEIGEKIKFIIKKNIFICIFDNISQNRFIQKKFK